MCTGIGCVFRYLVCCGQKIDGLIDSSKAPLWHEEGLREGKEGETSLVAMFVITWKRW